MEKLIKKEMDFISERGKMVQKFVDAGINFNMATLMNKNIAKKTDLEKVEFNLLMFCSGEQARELYGEAYALYHETEWV